MDTTTTDTSTTTDTTTTTATDTGATTSTETSTATTTPAETTASTEGQGEGEGASTTETTSTDSTETPEDSSQTDGAPETYEAFTLPEGVTLDGERLESAHAFFRQQGWSQQRSQDVIDAYMQFRGDEYAAERVLWAEQSEREFGSNFTAITEGAQRAIQIVEQQRPGITQRLDATNLGNHPDVLWLFAQFGELTKERPLIGLGGDTATPDAPKPVANRMFPHLT